MRICIPTENSLGRESLISDHFGSSRFFTICDLDKNELRVVVNDSHHHVHGQCNPITALQELKVDAVICRGMGRRAVQSLAGEGIKVYISNTPSVEISLRNFAQGLLSQISVDEACRGHGCH